MTRVLPCVLAAAALLAGCLFDRPLIVPGNAYDPRVALARDSLARFDTVEIRLVDPDDPSVDITLWRGPLEGADSLPPHLAGDGQTLVYVVRGKLLDKGYCHTERVSQEGKRLVLIDNCADPPIPDPIITVDPVVPVDPIDPGKDPKPGPVPGFAKDTLDFGEADTVLTLSIAHLPDTANGVLLLFPSESWIRPDMLSFPAGGVRDIRVRPDRSDLAVGSHSGLLVLSAQGEPLDTAVVIVSVPKPVADIRGTIVDWSDSAPQPGFAIALDGNAEKTFSDGDGSFSFPGVGLGPHVLTVTAPPFSGRIGRVDTFTLAAAGSYPRIVSVAPPRAFAAVDLGWKRVLGRAAIAGGQGLVVSNEFQQPGFVAAFPLDNPSPSLKRTFSLGNSDGDPEFPEYYEAVEVTADSQALFIAYPDAARLGRIGNWQAAPDSLSMPIPFQPGALLLRGPRLFALGRLPDSVLAIGEWNAADLSPVRVDTLAGFHWDGTDPSRTTPHMAYWDGSIYAVDGNGPGVKGQVLRIGMESRKVTGSKRMPDAILTGLAIHDGMIYVTTMSPSGAAIQILDPDLSVAGSIEAGMNTGRIEFATEGSLRGYGFAATESNAILVIHPLSKRPVGLLTLAGSRRALSLSVDGRSGTVLVSDGDKLHSIRF
jgi:carboxypeptidase family protein